MSEILCYMPTYSPNTEAVPSSLRSYQKLTNSQIIPHLYNHDGRTKPWVYMDAIDSVLNVRPDINLVVGDGRSTDSIRNELCKHQRLRDDYTIELYDNKLSQWIIFNDIYKRHTTPETKYFVYTSSDVIWLSDWVGECIKEFEANPKAQILFPCVTNGDPNLPCQVASAPRDLDSILPPYQEAARAPVLNMYAAVFRMDFLRAYGGYPTLFRNCYTESFLHYLCEAIGGQQRLVPRAHCYHWGTVDLWEENGSYYHYNEEINLFQETMIKVKMAHGAGLMSPEYLKKALWKN